MLFLRPIQEYFSHIDLSPALREVILLYMYVWHLKS